MTNSKAWRKAEMLVEGWINYWANSSSPRLIVALMVVLPTALALITVIVLGLLGVDAILFLAARFAGQLAGWIV